MVGTLMKIADVMVCIIISGRHFKWGYPFFVFANYTFYLDIKIIIVICFISYLMLHMFYNTSMSF